jgi:hypothetical protein
VLEHARRLDDNLDKVHEETHRVGADANVKDALRELCQHLQRFVTSFNPAPTMRQGCK